MPRNMSFMLTTEQIRNRTKTVTRRMGWKFLRPDDVLNACVKCMGLKPGEKIQRICQIRITSVSFEPLSYCTDHDATKEGFPELSGGQFCSFFASAMKCEPDAEITRIEFEYI